MKTVFGYFCLLVMLLAVSGNARPGIRQLRNLSASDGLPCNNISMMLQDGEGYLWIATANGLSRYDGYSFLNFNSTAGRRSFYPTNRINRMVADGQGRLLWVMSGKGQTGCFDTDRQQFVDFTGCGRYADIYWGFAAGRGCAWQYSDVRGARRIVRTGKGFVMTICNRRNGFLPSDHVVDIKNDAGGNSWLLTTGGIVKADGRGRKCFQLTRGDILAICTTGHGCLFLTRNGQIMEIDAGLKVRRLAHLPQVAGLQGGISDETLFDGSWFILTGRHIIVYDIRRRRIVPGETDYTIPHGRIVGQNASAVFIANNSGTLYRYGRNGKMKKWQLIPHQIIRYTRKDHFNIATTAAGTEYISTYGNGLFVYRPDDGNMQHYNKAGGQLNDDFIVNIMTDRAGNIWITNDHTGISCLRPSELKFRYLLAGSGMGLPESNSIRAFLPVAGGRLLASNMRGEILVCDTQTDRCTVDDRYGFNVYSMLRAGDGRTWIGTRGGGLWQKGKGRADDYPCADVYDIVEDRRQRLWTATSNGLVIVDTEGRNRYEHRLQGVFMHDIAADNNGNIWMATENGLYVAMAGDSRRIAHYDRRSSSFPSNDVICLKNTRYGMVAGTAGNGIVYCHLKGDRLVCTTVTTHNGLTSDIIHAVEEDRQGRLWVATEEGMSCVINRGRAVRQYFFADDITGNCFNENAGVTLENGEMAFGTRNGILVFDPAEIPAALLRPGMAITGLYVNGRPLRQSFNGRRHITLAYNENTLDIRFSDLMFADGKSAGYSYYMEGADKRWSDAQSANRVLYASLLPGHYVFHVKSLGNGTGSSEAVLEITIRRPWWNSNMAWTVYGIVALAGVMAWFSVTGKMRRMKMHLLLEKRITEMKINFFTNIANELRTPLTLIYGAVEKLRADSGGRSKATVQTLRNGTLRLMRTADQLALFRKLNLGQVHLRVERADVVAFTRELVDEYVAIALNRRCQLVFIPFASSFNMMFDSRKLALVLCGILSKAVEEAARGSSIVIKLKAAEGKTVFSIAYHDGNDENNGSAGHTLPPEAGDDVSDAGSYTAGIGIYISGQMAQVHHGQLDCCRTDAGECRYVVSIPGRDDAYTGSERTGGEEVAFPKNEMTEFVDREIHGVPFNDARILIVEDDEDMARMMQNYLGRFFNTAVTDSKKPLNLEEADVLIMDAGTTAGNDALSEVQRIKEDDRTAHLVVVLLTTGNDIPGMLKAIGSGADEILSKPYSLQVLLALISRQLKRRHEHISTVSRKTEQPVQQPVITTETDMRFKSEFERLLAQGAASPDFTVAVFASQMHYGLTQFHKKVKELTGCTPLENIRKARMAYVARLLVETRLTVDEIREKTGYTSSTLFFNHFRQQYGCSPARYRKTHAGGADK